jgi:hypothetical protein
MKTEMMEECGNHVNNFSLPLVMVVVLSFISFHELSKLPHDAIEPLALRAAKAL